MTYKWTTGSVYRGDVYYEDDRVGQPTYIDFGMDTITLRPSGSQILHAQADAVGIGTTSPDYTLDVAGNIGVDQYIYHNGDANTFINFSDDKLILKAGGKAMVTMEEKSSSPHDAPHISFNFLSTQIDKDTLLLALRKGRELMSAEPISDYVEEEIAPGNDLETDEEILTWVRNTAETTYHPVGTCKMGQDNMSVVDEKLIVNGLLNLRVVDASVMPTLTSGNTNAPTIMIAEKASDLILSKWN